MAADGRAGTLPGEGGRVRCSGRPSPPRRTQGSRWGAARPGRRSIRPPAPAGRPTGSPAPGANRVSAAIGTAWSLGELRSGAALVGARVLYPSQWPADSWVQGRVRRACTGRGRRQGFSHVEGYASSSPLGGGHAAGRGFARPRRPLATSLTYGEWDPVRPALDSRVPGACADPLFPIMSRARRAGELSFSGTAVMASRARFRTRDRKAWANLREIYYSKNKGFV